MGLVRLDDIPDGGASFDDYSSHLRALDMDRCEVGLSAWKNGDIVALSNVR
jgi:hypothetical protein